jgi:SnoaL-like domain
MVEIIMKLEEMETKINMLVETVEKLEASLKNTQDVEAVKKLQKAYNYYLQRWQFDEIIPLFSQSPDVTVEISDSGQHRGLEGVKKYFSHNINPPPEFLHILLPIAGIVDVNPDGKIAQGRWYGLGIQAIPIDGKIRARWTMGIWENEYVKEDGKWKFKKLFFNGIFSTPYEDGWVKTPHFAPGLKDKPAPGPDSPSKGYPSGYIFPYHYKNPVTGK